MKTIEDIREQLDMLDAQIVELLEARLRCSEAMGILKSQKHIIIEDSKREAYVLANMEAMVISTKHKRAIKEIYKSIFLTSKEMQALFKEVE